MFTLLLILLLISLAICNSNNIINNNNNKNGITTKHNTNTAITKLTTNINNINNNNNKNDITTKHAINNNNKNTISLSKYDRSLSKVLIVLLPLLYFISVSLNHVALPKIVNININNNINVSKSSASAYGLLTAVDALFTFLSVNLIGILSDKYGRKRFMIYSCLGLALSFTIIIKSKTLMFFYIAAIVDGLTSVMFSQAQAYLTDVNTDDDEKKRVGESLSHFQGLTVGIGYVIGILSGSMLMTKIGIKSPLYLGIGLLLTSSVLIAFFLPETVSRKDKKINFSDANPLGAMILLTRSKTIILSSIAYFFLNLSIAGLQVIWFNYLDYKFHWGIEKVASTLVVQYLLISIMSKIMNKIFGSSSNVILASLFIHAISVLLLSNANSALTIYMTMVLLSAGISASPSLLGYLTNQVSSDEVGALQGSVDTIRTITIAIAHPIISKIFANTITNSHDNIIYLNPFYICSCFSFIAFIVYAIEWKSKNDSRHKEISIIKQKHKLF